MNKKTRGFISGTCKEGASLWKLPVILSVFFYISSLLFPNINVHAESYSASMSGSGQVSIELTGGDNSNTANSTITANTTKNQKLNPELYPKWSRQPSLNW